MFEWLYKDMIGDGAMFKQATKEFSKSLPGIMDTMSKLEKAEQCPNCLSRNLEYDTFETNEYFIACVTCGLAGPYKGNDSVEKAVAAWNNLPRREENAHE